MLEQSFKQSFVNREVSLDVNTPVFRADISIMSGSRLAFYLLLCRRLVLLGSSLVNSRYLGLSRVNSVKKCGMAFEAKEKRSPAPWKLRMAIFECRMGKSEGG
jgi:hypothetical protein